MTDRRYVYLSDGAGRRLEPFLPSAANPRVPLGPLVPTVSTPYLPFDMPVRSLLAASPYKVWAHYFTQFPLNISDTGDYYATYWLPPGGIEGSTDWRTWGGWTRDRPLTNPITSSANVNVGYGLLSKRYTIDDKKVEWDQLRYMGADGFCPDLLQLKASALANDAASPKGNTGPFRQRLELMMARDEINDPTLQVMMMPDGATGGTSSVANLVADMQDMAVRSGVYKNPATGKLIVAPYGPEFAPNFTRDVNFWPDFVTAATAAGIPPEMWFVFSEEWTAPLPAVGAPRLNPIATLLSRWGVSNPVDNLGTGNGSRGFAAYSTATYGKPSMIPVSPGDERKGKFNERRGFDNLVITWQSAIAQKADGATAVQMRTWNDYGERANLAPSRNHGYVLTDISAYFCTQFKLTGYVPPIIRDCVMLSHRIQFLNGTTYTAPNPPYTTKEVVSGNTPAEDNMHIMAWATDDNSVVDFLVNGSVVSTQAVPKGVTIVKTPLQLGNISARMRRGAATVASVASPFPVASTQIAQDTNYRYVSSLRG